MKKGFIEFDFDDELTESEVSIKAPGLNSDNIISFSVVPVKTEQHEVDEFFIEDIKVSIKETKNNLIILKATAPNGASNKYKFKYFLSYD